ncbi:MAG: CRISPR-associated endonuclease Cas3'' [Planctomycetes bacterium]|nr:CRISPR-associated endonuclease Cas3'' [Planctomycetota bacterium]
MCPLASRSAPRWSSTRTRPTTGWFHDLGKYGIEFQRMIRGIRVQKEKTWHKQAGAAKAFDVKNAPVALAIAGHHGGLPDATKMKDAVNGSSGRDVSNRVWAAATVDCPDLEQISLAPVAETDSLANELLTRMVFSCLVDADWTDTADHARLVEGRPEEAPVPALDAEPWLWRVLKFIEQRAVNCREPFVAAARAHVLDEALRKAEEEPGFFSLTVPTGGGKTLSGLAFALKHAGKHGLRRMIYVAPYLSILDQNADVIREALGFERTAGEVFEHHSLAEPVDAPTEDGEKRATTDGDNETRLMSATRRAENWDAPIVITTSVQFFESLFANKPGQCRKLHNIARSVIVLDECQTLPPGLVAPTCGMLGQLVKRLGSSVVLCTATQPAFQHPAMAERLERVREIASPELALFERLRRVRVEWPKRDAPPLSWPEVAARMFHERAALCIVNTRRAARELFDELRKSCATAFHLSTSMCPAHRLKVLAEVKRRLDAGKRCYLVSTPLVEAGVDIDFPVVLRELAPLEAIIQAAGRCNREGTLNGPNREPGGRVIVFRSIEGAIPKDGWYETGRDVLTTLFLNQNRPPNIDAPADIQRYFNQLYWTKGPQALDRKGIQALRRSFNFPEVAAGYRLINDDGVAVLVASWAKRATEIESLLDAVRRRPTRANYRRLAPFQVNLRQHELAKLPVTAVEEAPGVLVWRGMYDAQLGFSPTVADAALIV